ncbi:MAG: cell division protein FtsL [Pseudomonadota bacterium]
MKRLNLQQKWEANRSGVLTAAAFSLVFGLVLGSGLWRSSNAQEMRSLYQELGVAQERQDELQAQHSRLLLEKSAYSSLMQVEKVAVNDLQMVFPEKVTEVQP